MKLTVLIVNIILVSNLFSQYEPNDPKFDDQWGHSKVQAPEAWDISLGQREIIVGIIDSGVNWGHDDLQGKIWNNSDEIDGNGQDDDNNNYTDDKIGYNFRDGHANPDDDFTGFLFEDKEGHGSLAAGIIAANINNDEDIAGLLNNVKIMSLKVTDEEGNWLNSDLASAINYAVSNGADIINISLWNKVNDSNVFSALQNARNQGILVVTCAGNGSSNLDNNPDYPSSYQLDNIIPVLATTTDDLKKSDSNYGATTVDLGAPGKSIISLATDNGTTTDGGTSFAAPYVTGALALLYSSASDDLHNYRMSDPVGASIFFKDVILSSVDPVTALNGLCTTGGRLNIYKAMQKIHKKISLVNRRDGGQEVLGGTLSLFGTQNGVDIIGHTSSNDQNVGVFYNFLYDSRTDQKELPNGEDYVKHLNWNGESSQFRFYNRDVLMHELKIDEIAYFKEQKNVTISSDHDFALELRDPWFVEGPGTVEDEQPDIFHPINSGTSYPVFLDQDPQDDKKPYSIKADQPQQTTEHGETVDWYFLNWEGTDVSFENANSNETDVVFEEENATVTASYKGHLLSNQSNGYSANNQRKLWFTYIDDKYHTIYTDEINDLATQQTVQKIFYSKSLNVFNDDWVKDEIFPNTDIFEHSVNPSLDHFPGTNDFYLVSEGTLNGSHHIYYTDPFLGGPLHIADVSAGSYGFNKPVIAVTDEQVFIAWTDNEPGEPLKYSVLISHGDGSWTWLAEEQDIPNTDSDCYNITLAADQSTDGEGKNYVHMAWQDGSGSIKYQKYKHESGQSATFVDYANISSGGGFDKVDYPSISLHDQEQPIVTWKGGVRDRRDWEYRTVVRTRTSSGWGTSFYQSGTEAVLSNVNSSDDGYSVIAYNRTNGENKYIKRSPTGNYTSGDLSTTGSDIQVSNGQMVGELKMTAKISSFFFK